METAEWRKRRRCWFYCLNVEHIFLSNVSVVDFEQVVNNYEKYKYLEFYI